MRFNAHFVGSAMLALASVDNCQAVPLLTNGDFETGDLTGWTVFDTTIPPGNVGENFGLPDVVSFDVTGSGATQAARLQVAHANVSDPSAGGGLTQSILLSSPGLLSVNVDFAALGSNADGGTFMLLIDGVSIDTFAVGDISNSAVVRGALSGSLPVIAGNHSISLEAERFFLNGSALGDTPFQFFDNAVAELAPSATSVPEPPSLALFGGGIALLCSLFLRRQGRLKAAHTSQT